MVQNIPLPTLDGLVKQTLNLLKESADSEIIDLDEGDGSGTATGFTTRDNIIDILNGTAWELARSVVPIGGWGQMAFPAGANIATLSFLSAGDGTQVWAVRGARWNGTPLRYCTRTSLERQFPTWASDAPGVPKFWYPHGNQIGLYPTPALDGALLVQGLVLPAALVADTDTPDWLAADQCKLLVYGSAVTIAKIDADNPVIYPRAEIWEAEFDGGKQRLWDELMANDPQLALAHFSPPRPGASIRQQ